MPRYHYQCELCEYEHHTRHGMGEVETVCPSCEGESLVRVMPYINYNNGEQKEATGAVVKRSIEEARQAIKEEKREATKEYEG